MPKGKSLCPSDGIRESKTKGDSIYVCQARLDEELSRLERTTGLGLELSAIWVPNHSSDKHGEVRENVIYIYDVSLDEALETLKHEFIDYCISMEVVEPLVSLINLQKAMIENLTYRRKEMLVDRLARII